MKKALKRNPNQQLKAERELRGWSQKYVAEQLSADHYYLSRWERGTAIPSPYYRQKLCTLFGKNARELGLLQEDDPLLHEVPAQEQEVPSVAVSQSMEKVVYDPAIPLFVAEGTGLVGRDNLVHRLKERLCRERGIALMALTGLPGAGKTTLAASMAQDADMLEHFSDGVLWAGLGPNPDILSHLSRWGMLLGSLFTTGSPTLPTDRVSLCSDNAAHKFRWYGYRAKRLCTGGGIFARGPGNRPPDWTSLALMRSSSCHRRPRSQAETL